MFQLSDSTQWTVRAQGDSNRIDRRQVSWFRVDHRNPGLLETLTFQDDETTETPPRIRVHVFRADGSIWNSDGSGMDRRRMRLAGILSGNAFERTVRIPRYGEGMLIRVEVRQTVTRPEFRSGELLRGGYACGARWISFRYPAGYDLRVGVRNGEGLALRADTVEAEGFREVRVSAQGLAPTQPFDRQAYPEEWYAGLHFSVPPAGKRSWTWKEIGDHYLGMISGSLAAGPAVRKAAAGLAAEAADSLAAGAFALVQARVRYLADEERLNAIVPRSPESVIGNGYGDCKEMANLLRALLHEKGLETQLVLTHSPGAPQLLEDFPSLAGFNHMILARAVPGGAMLYYDPTTAAAGAAYSCLPLLSQKLLRLAPGASRVDTLRPAPGFRNRVVTHSALSHRAGGGWDLRGTVALKGKAAFDLDRTLRYRYPGPAEARAAVRAFLAADFGIQASEWEWVPAAPDSVRITYAMPADAMLVSLGSGGVKLDAPALMGLGTGLGAGGLRDAEAEGERRLPAFEQEDHWTLPPGFSRIGARAFRRGSAEGNWSQEEAGPVRRFRCEGMAWKAGDGPDLAGFLDALSEFTLASVWQ